MANNQQSTNCSCGVTYPAENILQPLSSCRSDEYVVYSFRPISQYEGIASIADLQYQSTFQTHIEFSLTLCTNSLVYANATLDNVAESNKFSYNQITANDDGGDTYSISLAADHPAGDYEVTLVVWCGTNSKLWEINGSVTLETEITGVTVDFPTSVEENSNHTLFWQIDQGAPVQITFSFGMEQMLLSYEQLVNFSSSSNYTIGDQSVYYLMFTACNHISEITIEKNVTVLTMIGNITFSSPEKTAINTDTLFYLSTGEDQLFSPHSFYITFGDEFNFLTASVQLGQESMFNVNHVYEIPGFYNVCSMIYNQVDEKSFSSVIEVWIYNNLLINVSNDSPMLYEEVNVTLTWLTGEYSPSYTAMLDNGTTIIIEGNPGNPVSTTTFTTMYTEEGYLNMTVDGAFIVGKASSHYSVTVDGGPNLEIFSDVATELYYNESHALSWEWSPKLSIRVDLTCTFSAGSFSAMFYTEAELDKDMINYNFTYPWPGIYVTSLCCSYETVSTLSELTVEVFAPLDAITVTPLSNTIILRNEQIVPAQFNITSLYPISNKMTLLWNFEDNSDVAVDYYEVSLVEHIFNDFGTYNVSLTIAFYNITLCDRRYLSFIIDVMDPELKINTSVIQTRTNASFYVDGIIRNAVYSIDFGNDQTKVFSLTADVFEVHSIPFVYMIPGNYQVNYTAAIDGRVFQGNLNVTVVDTPLEDLKFNITYDPVQPDGNISMLIIPYIIGGGHFPSNTTCSFTFENGTYLHKTDILNETLNFTYNSMVTQCGEYNISGDIFCRNAFESRNWSLELPDSSMHECKLFLEVTPNISRSRTEQVTFTFGGFFGKVMYTLSHNNGWYSLTNTANSVKADVFLVNETYLEDGLKTIKLVATYDEIVVGCEEVVVLVQHDMSDLEIQVNPLIIYPPQEQILTYASAITIDGQFPSNATCELGFSSDSGNQPIDIFDSSEFNGTFNPGLPVTNHEYSVNLTVHCENLVDEITIVVQVLVMPIITTTAAGNTTTQNYTTTTLFWNETSTINEELWNETSTTNEALWNEISTTDEDLWNQTSSANDGITGLQSFNETSTIPSPIDDFFQAIAVRELNEMPDGSNDTITEADLFGIEIYLASPPVDETLQIITYNLSSGIFPTELVFDAFNVSISQNATEEGIIVVSVALTVYDKTKQFTFRIEEQFSCPNLTLTFPTEFVSELSPLSVFFRDSARLTLDVINPCADALYNWIMEKETSPGLSSFSFYQRHTTTSTVLQLPAGSLGQGLYKVSVSAFSGSTFLDSSHLYLRILESKLIAVINGGALRQVGRVNPFILDAGTGTYDPDWPDESLIYTWTCSFYNTSLNLCDDCGDLLQDPHDAKNTLNQNHLLLLHDNTTYVFKVTVNSGQPNDSREATASQSIKVIDDDPLLLEIRWVNGLHSPTISL